VKVNSLPIRSLPKICFRGLSALSVVFPDSSGKGESISRKIISSYDTTADQHIHTCKVASGSECENEEKELLGHIASIFDPFG
jgi:precorrin-2 methylase